MKRAPRKGEGRPTKYKPEFIQKADEYIKKCQDEETDWLKSYTEGKVSGETYEHRVKVNLPTHEGFATSLQVDITSLYEWARKNKQFSLALSRISTAQKERLLSKGLSGDYNSTIAKLILSANHGMKEKTDVTSNDKEIEGVIISTRK